MNATKCTVLLCLALISLGRADDTGSADLGNPGDHLADHGHLTPDKWNYPKQPLTNDQYITCKRLLDLWQTQALQKIDDTHSHMWYTAWAPSFASLLSNGGANVIPNVVVGTLAGMGADAVTLGSWYYLCKTDYDAATNVEQLFSDLFSVKNAASVENATGDYLYFQLLGKAPEFIYGALKKSRNTMADMIISTVTEGCKKVSDKVMAGVAAHGVSTTANPVTRIPASVLAESPEFKTALAEASAGAVGEVTTRVNETLASRAAGRFGEAATGEIPIIGAAVGAVTGFTLMRMCAGDINNDFRDSYKDAVNTMYHTVCNKILHPDSDTIKSITGQI